MNKLSHPPAILVNMDNQLVLLDDEKGGDTAASGAERLAASWRLDEHTREIGRRGVAQAREALRQAGSRAA